ncbi:energy transducer TonB [Candidatus Poribacteria bacterium]|nr:energy transducer TonB [Candidatus Poribacteria bacterium]
MRKKGFGIFLIAALVEHIIIVIALAAAIYTRPPEKMQEDILEVELLNLPPPSKKTAEEEQVYIVIPKVEEKIDISDQLPTFQLSRPGNKNLGTPDFDIKLPNLPRTAGADINPDRIFSSPKTRDAERGERTDSDTVLPFKDAPQRPGLYGGTVALDTIPEKGDKRVSAGRFGTSTSRYVANAPSLGTSRKPGLGPGGVSITAGDIQGRMVEYWPEIPEYSGKDVGKVVLKFWVTPQGDVFNVQTKLKAGNPLLEKLAKRFVEDIKFAPLPNRAKQINQWGEITIDFIQKKLQGQEG